MVWYSHLLKNFPQFIVIHTVKGFGIVNKAEIDVFLELSCFFLDPADVESIGSTNRNRDPHKKQELPGSASGKEPTCQCRRCGNVMLKILQAKLQQYVNRELPDVQAGSRKGKVISSN